jgi:putative tryptophan/tyrosine transport system substrate-binding protein
MNRRAFVAGLGAVFGTPIYVKAQQATKVYRVGVLLPTPISPESAFVAMRKERADALVVIADVLTLQNRDRIASLAIKNHLPAISEVRDFATSGGLAAYGPDAIDIARRAAGYVDKILKGAKPADLPVEQPTKFELVINVKTAKALGLMIPPSLLRRADRVIE